MLHKQTRIKRYKTFENLKLEKVSFWSPSKNHKTLDKVVRAKRPLEEPSPLEPKPKMSLTDEQRKRMEENKAKALAKKAEREKAKLLEAAAAQEETSREVKYLNQFRSANLPL